MEKSNDVALFQTKIFHRCRIRQKTNGQIRNPHCFLELVNFELEKGFRERSFIRDQNYIIQQTL